MKKTNKFIIFILMLVLGVNTVEAKDVLHSCEYYKPYDQLSGSLQAGVLCNIYTDYSHKCYVNYGSNVATTSDNKEDIQNWGYAVGLTWKAKDYVKENNKCPDYLLLKLESGWDGYEIHAAESKDEAIDLQLDLYGQRYIAVRKGLQKTEEEINKATQNVQNSINDINGIINSYSLQSCIKPDKVITRLEDCESIISSLKSRIYSYENNVYNFINEGYFTENDEIIKNYREAKKNSETFIENAEKELETENKKIQEELGLTDGDIDMSPIVDGITTGDIDCDGIFAGQFGKTLKEVLSLIRFVVPLIIIGLSIVDFIKATAAQDDSEIKKAANKLVKRMIVGVIIFLLPTLLEFILYLAGIEYGTCGIK